MNRISRRCLAAIFSLVLFAAGTAGATEGVSGSSDGLVLKSVAEMLNVVQKAKLSLDEKAASRAVVEALIKTANPSARIYTSDEVSLMKDVQQGFVYDVGLKISATNGLPVVTEVVKDSAAESAGIKVGEMIEKIGDQEILSGTSAQAVTRLLRSEKPGRVTVKIRDENGISRDVELERDRVKQQAIESAEDLPSGLCYLQLNGVFEGCGRDIVSTLRGWAESGRVGVIIDLRGADGMDLESAADIAGLFAESGAMLFAVRDMDNQDIEVFKAKAQTILGMPAMVLIDQNTVGAAEILAAVLSDSVRGAMLLGHVTGGDPVVRDWMSLSSGDSLYTVARRIVMADGHSYDGREGVKPDVVLSENAPPVPDYEPESAPPGREITEEEKQDKKLRERVKNDPALRRAADVLLGLKALNIRGVGFSENPTN